jgi:hypothetical protein
MEVTSYQEVVKYIQNPYTVYDRVATLNSHMSLSLSFSFRYAHLRRANSSRVHEPENAM